MQTTLRLETTILPGHRLEIRDPELPDGAKVEVIVVLPEQSKPLCGDVPPYEYRTPRNRFAKPTTRCPRRCSACSRRSRKARRTAAGVRKRAGGATAGPDREAARDAKGQTSASEATKRTS